MKKTLLVHVALALCCLAGVATAQEATIGVYMDTAGSTCTGATSAGVLQGSIWVNLGSGAAAGGITGAEFGVEYDNRTDLTLQFDADPAALFVIHDPFKWEDSGGVNMAYDPCQTGTSGRVQLGTFTVLENNVGTVGQTWFTVRPKIQPSNPELSCAMLTLCDAPVYTAVCVSPADSFHWRAVMNPNVGTTADCTPVAVTASTWSQVKEIFRN
jgi:hypothetical protein